MCLACNNDCCTLDLDDSCNCDDCHNAFCWSAEAYADKYGTDNGQQATLVASLSPNARSPLPGWGVGGGGE